MVSPIRPLRLRPRSNRVGLSEVPVAAMQRPAAAAAAADPPPPPGNLLCPISLEVMCDPVKAPGGITYDRESIEGWLATGTPFVCPVTDRPLRAEDLVPNHAVRRMVETWRAAYPATRVEAAPAPRVPAYYADDDELLAALSDATARGDGAACRDKARARGKENGRDDSRVAARALSLAFVQLVEQQPPPVPSGALGKILAALVTFFPLDEESRRRIASPAPLDALVSMLSRGKPRAAAAVLREIAAASDAQCLDAMCDADGIYAALVKVMGKQSTSAKTTKAALVTACCLAAHAGAAASRLVEHGVVRVLVDLLVDVDADKGTTEKALAVMDRLLVTEEGRGEALAHALAVPVLVKKARGNVSDAATELAVSALCRLCKSSSGDGTAAVALHVGALEKLFLLQLRCMGVAKKTSELLRLLKGSKGGCM